MILLWGLIMGLPLLAFGGAASFSNKNAQRFANWFEQSREVAIALTVVAWLWTAYECSTINIDVFDSILLKSQTHGVFVWVLAVVLSYLTVIWMPKNLPVRALTGILMLIPAALFRVTRELLPAAGGVGAVHLFVVVAYVGCVIGMYGMFYPWRLEKGLAIVLRRDWSARLFGGVLAATGAGLLATAFMI